MVKTDVAIIGAGIVGSTCALYLAETGLDVTLIERQDIASGASYGNAGALAFAEILPLAAPGIIRKSLKWLLDPLGPLSLPPAYLPKIAPWLIRFWLASRHYHDNIKAQYQLMQLAASEVLALLDKYDLNHHLVSEGVLELYDNAQTFTAGQAAAKLRAEYGIQSQELDAAAIAELQPGIANSFRHGMYLPFWRNIADPYKLTEAIAKLALQHKVSLIRRQACKLSHHNSYAYIQLNDASTVQARHVIVCAGAWSGQLSTQIGDYIPLDTERGYNTTLAADAFALNQQITFVDHGFVVSPLSCGVRVGGSVELAGLKREPNLLRAKAMLNKAKQFLPGLNTDHGKQWMGFRPSTPDSLPVIGVSSQCNNIIYAFGHGHLGLTQAAATAKLVQQLVRQEKTSIDIKAYSPDRFKLF